MIHDHVWQCEDEHISDKITIILYN